MASGAAATSGAAAISDTATKQQCYVCNKAFDEQLFDTCPECNISVCRGCQSAYNPCGYFGRVCCHCRSGSCKRRFLSVYESPGTRREISLCATGPCYDEYAEEHVVELCTLDEALAAYVNLLKDNQTNA